MRSRKNEIDVKKSSKRSYLEHKRNKRNSPKRRWSKARVARHRTGLPKFRSSAHQNKTNFTINIEYSRDIGSEYHNKYILLRDLDLPEPETDQIPKPPKRKK